MKKIIVANWKMNPKTEKEAVCSSLSVSRQVKGTKGELIICPPFPFIPAVKKAVSRNKNIRVAAQNCFCEETGAFVGEVSFPMLKSLGVNTVVVGHSGRRALGETIEDINKKVRILLKNGFYVILCLGEKERDEKGDYLRLLEAELKAMTSGVLRKNFKKLIVTYEPVWAVGKGSQGSDNPESIKQIVLFLKKILVDIAGREIGLSVPILYGGSVDEKNVAEIISVGGVDGVMVGRASLDAEKFVKMVKNI